MQNIEVGLNNGLLDFYYLFFVCHFAMQTILGLCMFALKSNLFVFCPTQVSHLFDNEGTVAFAMFMAIWGQCLIYSDLVLSWCFV